MIKQDPRKASGDRYVDTRCMDCGAARTGVPKLIVEGAGRSMLAQQLDHVEDVTTAPLPPCAMLVGSARASGIRAAAAPAPIAPTPSSPAACGPRSMTVLWRRRSSDSRKKVLSDSRGGPSPATRSPSRSAISKRCKRFVGGRHGCGRSDDYLTTGSNGCLRDMAEATIFRPPELNARLSALLERMAWTGAEGAHSRRSRKSGSWFSEKDMRHSTNPERILVQSNWDAF